MEHVRSEKMKSLELGEGRGGDGRTVQANLSCGRYQTVL
jgi:hypothetical protein